MDPYSTQLLIMNQISRLSDLFMEHIRSILFALSLMILGLIIAEVVKYLSVVVLRVARWEQFCEQLGLSRWLKKLRPDVTAAVAAGEILFWLTFLGFFMQALIITGISPLSGWGQMYFDMFPLLVEAIISISVAVILARYLTDAMYCIIENSLAPLLAGFVRMVIIHAGVYLGMVKLGMGQEIALSLIAISLAGMVLAWSGLWLVGREREYRRVIRVYDHEEGV